jgi:hypothetical protein
MLLSIETEFCCAFPKHAKTPLSRTNEATTKQQIALRSLIANVKHAMAELAAAKEGRLLDSPWKSLFAP